MSHIENGIVTPIIIAEIGNNAEGVLPNVYKLIDAAKNAGADLVKLQAGTARGFARTESQIDFYRKYVIEVNDFIDVWLYCNQIEIPLFFSIWNDEVNTDYEVLRNMERWHKIPARQCTSESILKYDSPTTFISMPAMTNSAYELFPIKQGIPMHVVSEYPTTNPQLHYIKALKSKYGKAGYSDHTIGISACEMAVKHYGAIAVEKHFTLDKKTNGLRDHLLSADPMEFERMVRAIK